MVKRYKEEDLRRAVSAVKQNRMNILQAAREYGVPRTTVFDHLRGKVQSTKCGRELELQESEESALAFFIKYVSDHGFPMSRNMIRCYAREIIRRSGRVSRINLVSGPSDQWFRNFFQRHPDLSERKPENMQASRTRMSNEECVSKWFTFLDDTLQKYGLKDMPERIFNCDETGWTGKESSRTKVSGRKGGHLFRQKATVNNHVTAHLCICADGRFIPTMVIFQGCLPHRTYKDGIPSSWYYSSSDSGYMDGELFAEWFKECFLPNCGRERPVGLIMDNHDSHLTLPLVEMAIANDIVLIGLPAHTTHILQPLDVKVIGPLKGRVTTIAERCGFLNKNFTISKARFPIILSYAIDQTTPASVKESFIATGICPLNQGAIDKSQLVPASFKPPTSAENTESTEQVRSCPTCGAYNLNPLVKDGLVPKALADVLMPPPTKPQTEQKKSRVVLEGRVISGEDMLKKLREKEKALEEKMERQEERKKKRLLKAEEKLTKEKEKMKRKEEKAKRLTTKSKQMKQPSVQRQPVTADAISRNDRKSRLASPIYTCGVCSERGRVDDEAQGIEWVGCDEDMCLAWYHFTCLSNGEKEYVRESLSEGSDWFCKECKPWLYSEE